MFKCKECDSNIFIKTNYGFCQICYEKYFGNIENPEEYLKGIAFAIKHERWQLIDERLRIMMLIDDDYEV